MVNPFLLSSSRNFFLLVSFLLPASWMSLTSTKSHFSSACPGEMPGGLWGWRARSSCSRLQLLRGLDLRREHVEGPWELGAGSRVGMGKLRQPLPSHCPAPLFELCRTRWERGGGEAYQGGKGVRVFHRIIPPGSQQNFILQKRKGAKASLGSLGDLPPGAGQTSPSEGLGGTSRPGTGACGGTGTRLSRGERVWAELCLRRTETFPPAEPACPSGAPGCVVGPTRGTPERAEPVSIGWCYNTGPRPAWPRFPARSRGGMPREEGTGRLL